MRQRSPGVGRFLAPLAMVAFAVAFIVVFNSSGVKDTSTSTAAPPPTTTSTTARKHSKSKYAHRRTYTVKSGDTLGGISIKTGVSVSTLEDLNAGLDPQGLVAGQKLKLR